MVRSIDPLRAPQKRPSENPEAVSEIVKLLADTRLAKGDLPDLDIWMRRKAQIAGSMRSRAQENNLPSRLRQNQRAVFEGRVSGRIGVLNVEDSPGQIESFSQT